MKDKLGWAGTALTLTGVTMQAMVPALVPWSYPVFIAAAGTWFTNAWMERNRPHVALQSVLIVLNVIATYRYLLT